MFKKLVESLLQYNTFIRSYHAYIKTKWGMCIQANKIQVYGKDNLYIWGIVHEKGGN